MKRTKTLKIILLIFSVILFIFLGVGYYTGYFFLSGITPCHPPPGIMVDGAAEAKVFTWLDEDMDGKIDSNENPLPHVEIAHPFEYEKYTNDDGTASAFTFKPGCVCDCWAGEYVEVIIPDGFRPTTPTRQEMTGQNLRYEFGFVRINP